MRGNRTSVVETSAATWMMRNRTQRRVRHLKINHMVAAKVTWWISWSRPTTTKKSCSRCCCQSNDVTRLVTKSVAKCREPLTQTNRRSGAMWRALQISAQTPPTGRLCMWQHGLPERPCACSYLRTSNGIGAQNPRSNGPQEAQQTATTAEAPYPPRPSSINRRRRGGEIPQVLHAAPLGFSARTIIHPSHTSIDWICRRPLFPR
jgi:hypothetical protein